LLLGVQTEYHQVPEKVEELKISVKQETRFA
jgi:hypothetical protein